MEIGTGTFGGQSQRAESCHRSVGDELFAYARWQYVGSGRGRECGHKQPSPICGHSTSLAEAGATTTVAVNLFWVTPGMATILWF